MFRSSSTPLITTVASVSAIVAATTFVGGLVIFLLSGVPAAKAEAEKVAVQQAPAEDNRLPVFVKGAACSALGWPNYEPSCQFDMRRPGDEMRTVRIVALR